MEIRNIAIIAHVDHGKTTLVDALMRQNNATSEENFSMDSNALEKERGITIYAKNTSLFYKGTKINIVDTPGHADFSSEVERVLRSIDNVVLLVDAQEGPMPQTRFVLKKSLEIGFKPIVVINKIDKKAARAKEVEEEIFELFLELGANDEQINFPILYAVGRDGIAKKSLDDTSTNLNPLLDCILEKISPSKKSDEKELRAQVFNLGYDNFLGRLCVARIYQGKLLDNSRVFIVHPTKKTWNAKVIKIFTFEGTNKKEIKEAIAGDIVMIAGLAQINIGDTITDQEGTEPLPAIAIDEPTISLNFLVNNSPFAGQDGKFLTSRQIRERLEKELEINVGLKIDFTSNEYFKVYGRGELHIAILLENMRREGYELQVSQPQVIIKEENGVKLEPYEEVIIDVPENLGSTVIDKLSRRKALLKDVKSKENLSRLTFEIPTRGLLGYRNQFVIDTRGEGIMSSRVIGFKEFAGEVKKHELGSQISMTAGKALAYALWNLQDRGTLYISPNTNVYEGMVLGNTSKGEDLDVNPTKGKQLTNVRASGSDEAIQLVPAWTLSLERGLEIMQEDEYLEITPKNIRLRKKYLSKNDRVKAAKKES